MPTTNFLEEPATAPPAISAPAPVPAPSAVKLKAAQIIDQGLDIDVAPLERGLLSDLRARYVTAEGDAPLEKEEIADAQLSCLDWKVKNNIEQLQSIRGFRSVGTIRRQNCKRNEIHCADFPQRSMAHIGAARCGERGCVGGMLAGFSHCCYYALNCYDCRT